MLKKTLLTLGLGILLFTSPLHAAPQPLGLEWDANDLEDNVVGYKLYASRVSGEYGESKIVANITTGLSTDVTLADGVWFFVVTAYNIRNSESGYSNEISKKLGVGDPTGLRFINITVTVDITP